MMKKLIALILSLVMILGAASALQRIPDRRAERADRHGHAEGGQQRQQGSV